MNGASLINAVAGAGKWCARHSLPCKSLAMDHRLPSVSPVKCEFTQRHTSKNGASSPNTQTPWPAALLFVSEHPSTTSKQICRTFGSVTSMIPFSSYLYHTSLPTDPKAAELIPRQDPWRRDADKRLAHFASGNPGTSVLPAPEYDLQHLRAVVGTGREGKMGIVVCLYCHQELVHPAWLFHILILIFVGGRNMNPLWEMKCKINLNFVKFILIMLYQLKMIYTDHLDRRKHCRCILWAGLLAVNRVAAREKTQKNITEIHQTNNKKVVLSY